MKHFPCLIALALASLSASAQCGKNGTSPSGTVAFYDGSTLLGTGTLNNGVASFSTSALAVGSHSITAKYSGDSSCATSTSSPRAVTVSSGSSSAPYTDNFTGTGTLASPWALSNNGAGTMPTKNNGTATAASSARTVVLYNSSYNDPNKSVIKSTGTNAYPVIQGHTGDDSLYVWAVTDNVIFRTNPDGSYNKGIASSCPVAGPTDTLQLAMNSSGQITATDVTTGATCSGTDATPLTGGYPGIWFGDSSSSVSAPAIMGNN